MESTKIARGIVLAGVMLVAGCQTIPDPVIPPPEIVVRNCLGEATFPEWVFEELPVPYLEEVKRRGGTNAALLSVFNQQRLLLESANSRLVEIGRIIDDAIRSCEPDPA